MKLSRYTKIFPSPDDGNSVVLFSTRTSAAVQASSSLIADIEKGALSEDESESLRSLGFLVPDPEQERQEMLGYIRELNKINKSLRFIVVLNLDCNLGCKYCFEGERKGKFYLSDETADEFIDFIKRNDLAGREDIQITFYGGEPLLSTAQIERISAKVRSFAEGNALRYGFSLVTNGTLLTPEVVKKLSPLGLKSAKVTLDGPKAIHDKFRPFKSGRGSFDVILRNIAEVCETVRLQIGGNYTQEHYREFPRLLDILAENGLTPQKIPIVKFDPVIRERDGFGPADFHDGCESVNEPWVSEAALYLREEVLKLGYHTQRIMPAPCLLELENSVVVNYDGRLYKCPGLIGRKDCCVGDVALGLKDYRVSHGLDAWKNEECLECAYLPLCFGGCKYMQLLRTGDLRGINCKKEHLDRTLGELVAQDVKYEL